jgi:hypothetical protein
MDELMALEGLANSRGRRRVGEEVVLAEQLNVQTGDFRQRRAQMACQRSDLGPKRNLGLRSRS